MSAGAKHEPTQRPPKGFAALARRCIRLHGQGKRRRGGGEGIEAVSQCNQFCCSKAPFSPVPLDGCCALTKAPVILLGWSKASA